MTAKEAVAKCLADMESGAFQPCEDYCFDEKGNPTDPVGYILHLGGFKFNGSFGSSERYRKSSSDKLNETFGPEFVKLNGPRIEWLVIDTCAGDWSKVREGLKILLTEIDDKGT